jgi:hypothetical protein
MPSTRLITEMRLPESSTPSVLNSTVVLGVRRIVLPSSNSISARPRSRVFTCVPCVTGRLRNAFSNPRPVFLSICTEPCTSLRRTMRACEPANAGSAISTQAEAVRRTILNLESDSLDISKPPKGLRRLLEHGLPKGIVKLKAWDTGRQPESYSLKLQGLARYKIGKI